MPKRPSLKINAISNWTSLFVHIAVGFYLTPFIIAHLGQSGYGIWVLVGSFIGYYGLLTLGVGSAITRYIARYSAQNDAINLNKTANTALVMFSITGLLAIIVSFLVAEPLARFFKVDPEHFAEFKRIVWILGIATGLSFPGGVFSAVITARERFVLANVVHIATTLLRTGLTVAILQAGYGLSGIVYPTLAAAVFSIVAFIVLAKRIVPEFHIRPRLASFAVLKMLLVYGGFTVIIAVADILRLQLDSVVIGRMVGLPEVGVYGVAALLIHYMLKLVVSGMGVLTPRFAALDGTDDRQELQITFLRSLSVSSFIACGAGVMALLFGGSFLSLWVGKEFGAAIPVLMVLATSYMLALSQTPGIGLMYALNKHRYYAAVTIVEAIANVALSILLAPRYGIFGVAMGTAIPMTVVKIFIQPIYVSRLVALRLRDYVKAIAPAFLITITMVSAFYFAPRYWKVDSIEISTYFELSVAMASAGLIYFLLNFCFSPNVRRLALSLLPKSRAIKGGGFKSEVQQFDDDA